MELHMVLVAFHLLGFAFGVGGATVSDVTFVRSVRDGKVTESEYNIIKTISKVVWTSVVILILSGIWLLYLEYGRLGSIPRLEASFFQLKMTAFAVLVANGIVFHAKVFPLLKSAIGKSFRSDEIRQKYGFFAFTGGVSIVSWYTAFLAVAFSRVLGEYSYLFLLNIYAFLVLGAGTMAYLVLNKHADESGMVQAVKTLLRSVYFKKVFAAGLILLVPLVLQAVVIWF